jgi:hypothetical protein
MNAATQPELIDRLMDMYVEWREECATVWEAYACWRAAPLAEKAPAFASYRAAVDREEWAAHVYADQVSRLTPPIHREHASLPRRDQRLAA